jgi:hypothetical protein
MAASAGQLAKRAFVAVLLSLASQYGLTVKINRDSPDAPLEAAFRKVVKQAHPDKSGSTDDAQKLQAARDYWTKTRCASVGPKLKEHVQQGLLANGQGSKKQPYRIQSTAVMLTYQSVTGLPQWSRFSKFVEDNVKFWLVCYWCAALETCKHLRPAAGSVFDRSEPVRSSSSSFVCVCVRWGPATPCL